jgi:ubiquinone biosynthesis protein
MSQTLPLNEALLEALGIDSLVPPLLERWRPLVIEGVLSFLQGLPPEHQAAIGEAQLALPEDAEPGQRLVALLSQCPTLHKLGQVLARHRELPEALRYWLRGLESMPPVTPFEQVLQSIRAELPADAPVEIAGFALAEASVAVVVPFTWSEGDQTRHGVFKILKPGVAARLGAELAVWRELGAFLEERARELRLPSLDYRGTLESVADLVANEVRLELEQENLLAAAGFHSGDPRVLVPRLLPWSTPRMTAMERVFGMKVTDAPRTASERRRLADSLVTALLARPFWDRTGNCTVHGDPHAGNLFATDDGRLAILDWSLVARLSKADREAVVDAALGGLTLDADRVCRAIAALGTIPPEHPILRQSVERALAQRRSQGRPGFDWLISLLDDLAAHIDAGFRSELVLFRKTWITLAGVLRDLAGDYDPDAALLGVALERFTREIPERMFAPPGSRAFDTHVSNADLAGLSFALMLAPTRYWLGLLQEGLAQPPAGLSPP